MVEIKSYASAVLVFFVALLVVILLVLASTVLLGISGGDFPKVILFILIGLATLTYFTKEKFAKVSLTVLTVLISFIGISINLFLNAFSCWGRDPLCLWEGVINYILYIPLYALLGLIPIFKLKFPTKNIKLFLLGIVLILLFLTAYIFLGPTLL